MKSGAVRENPDPRIEGPGQTPTASPAPDSNSPGGFNAAAQKVVYSMDDVFQSSVASLRAVSMSSPVTENVVSMS